MAVNLTMFFVGLISLYPAPVPLVVAWLPLPNVGLNTAAFFTTPDGRLFIVGGMYRGLMEYDREGRHIRTHGDPTVREKAESGRWATSSDGRIFVSFTSRRSERRFIVYELDSHLRLIAEHARPSQGVAALADDGRLTFVPYEGSKPAKYRPVRPGELLFPVELPRTQFFDCDDGSSIERVLLGLRRYEPDGSSRRVGPPWWIALVTPPVGTVLAFFVAWPIARWLGLLPPAEEG